MSYVGVFDSIRPPMRNKPEKLEKVLSKYRLYCHISIRVRNKNSSFLGQRAKTNKVCKMRIKKIPYFPKQEFTPPFKKVHTIPIRRIIYLRLYFPD